MSAKRALALTPLRIAPVLVGLGAIAAIVGFLTYALAAVALTTRDARKRAFASLATTTRRFSGRTHAR